MGEKSCNRLGASCAHNIYILCLKNSVNGSVECISVETLKSILDFIYIRFHNVVDNVTLADTLLCNLNTLIGGKLNTYKLLNGKLELRVALKAKLVCKSDNRRLRNSNKVTKLCGG